MVVNASARPTLPLPPPPADSAASTGSSDTSWVLFAPAELSSLHKLVSMGFTRDASLRALLDAQWDPLAAINLIVPPPPAVPASASAADLTCPVCLDEPRTVTLRCMHGLCATAMAP